MRALIGIRNGLIISMVLWGLIFFAVKCFAETFTKIDDNTVKITSTTEKSYTHEDLTNRINGLKADRDGVQRNLDLLNANIAGLEKQLSDVEKAGVKAKEQPKEPTTE